MQHLKEKGKGAETDPCRESKTKTPELWILLHLFSDFIFSLGKFLRNVFHVYYILILIGLTISLTLWSRFRDLPSISAVKIEFKHFLCPPPQKKTRKRKPLLQILQDYVTRNTLLGRLWITSTLLVLLDRHLVSSMYQSTESTESQTFNLLLANKLQNFNYINLVVIDILTEQISIFNSSYITKTFTT